MILPSSTPSPIPSGYITDGLIFFLDGKQVDSASSWTDIVGGKTFALTNCTLGTNGVVFDGTAYGLYNGRISDDCFNETIEVVYNGRTNIVGCCFFCQPYMDNSVGISLRHGYENTNTPRFAYALDGVSRAYKYKVVPTGMVRCGVTADRVILNNAAATSTHTTYYTANNTGTTVLGGQRFSNDVVKNMYKGTIYCIRIYNRKLTANEISANQANDSLYYA